MREVRQRQAKRQRACKQHLHDGYNSHNAHSAEAGDGSLRREGEVGVFVVDVAQHGIEQHAPISTIPAMIVAGASIRAPMRSADSREARSPG